jgi:hypothetical protein
VRYEWDAPKQRANLAKHGVDFAAIVAFQWDSALEIHDNRRDYGEPRWIVLGWNGTRLHTLIYTRRGHAIRVISLRKSNAREVSAYERQKQ